MIKRQRVRLALAIAHRHDKTRLSTQLFHLATLYKLAFPQQVEATLRDLIQQNTAETLPVDLAMYEENLEIRDAEDQHRRMIDE